MLKLTIQFTCRSIVAPTFVWPTILIYLCNWNWLIMLRIYLMRSFDLIKCLFCVFFYFDLLLFFLSLFKLDSIPLMWRFRVHSCSWAICKSCFNFLMFSIDVLIIILEYPRAIQVPNLPNLPRTRTKWLLFMICFVRHRGPIVATLSGGDWWSMALALGVTHKWC